MAGSQIWRTINNLVKILIKKFFSNLKTCVYITFKKIANKDQYLTGLCSDSALETLVATFLSTRFKNRFIHILLFITHFKFAKVI